LHDEEYLYTMYMPSWHREGKLYLHEEWLAKADPEYTEF
jgi:hypothetical protein